MKKQLFFYIIGLLISTLFFSCQDTERLKLSQRINYLVKDTVLYNYFLMDYTGVAIYENEQMKSLDRPECKIYYSELDAFNQLFKKLPTSVALDTCIKKGVQYFSTPFTDKLLRDKTDGRLYSSDQPLDGVKIAIDPVHIGGSYVMAALEQKLIKMLTATGDTIFIDEGALTLATARILEVKLKRLGAQVLLTRKQPGEAAIGKTFDQWLKEDFHTWVQWDFSKGLLDRSQAEYLKLKADRAYIFNQYFKKKDLQARAQRINEFKPDLTLMIRYNVHEPNWKKQNADGFIQPTKKNYSLAFVPGAFMDGEMKTQRDRFEFLRLFLTDDINESVAFSKMLLQHANYKLGVSPVNVNASFDYLKNGCLSVEPGIYSRNLSMTRLVHGPLSYGEVLCVDNEEECKALTKKELKIGNIITSKRVEQVADTYIAAIKDYFNPEEKKLTEDDLMESGS